MAIFLSALILCFTQGTIGICRTDVDMTTYVNQTNRFRVLPLVQFHSIIVSFHFCFLFLSLSLSLPLARSLLFGFFNLRWLLFCYPNFSGWGFYQPNGKIGHGGPAVQEYGEKFAFENAIVEVNNSHVVAAKTAIWTPNYGFLLCVCSILIWHA